MQQFTQEAKELLEKELGEQVELLTPPDRKLGDAAFACFGLAKKHKKNPNQIAQELSTKLAPYGQIKKIEANGAYVNFFCDKQKLAAKILPIILSKKEQYGRGAKKEETVMVEFFQANTHKAVHVGHARNMCIGIAISNLLEFTGYKVV
ncbi:MAG: arginine--tRNA ligase, partial [Candidatus Woesearchaeota archaeon]